MNIQTGAILEGRYEILSTLGKGGYGIVYRARQISTGQDVAVKLLLEEHFTEPDRRELLGARFEREMQLIAQLKHPNIVRLIDSGRLDDGRLFTVLEFIEGEELAEIIDREGRLEEKEARRLMLQVLDALASAHAQGIIHRDLKPENIMITTTGYRRNAMVLDFGIAAVLESARGKDYIKLTSAGHFQGTPSYMAPEQLKELELTPQSDIFSWGLVFLECLTGQIAVYGETVPEIIFQMMRPKPIPLPDELKEHPIASVLSRAIAKPLDERFGSVDEVVEALELCDNEGSGERPLLRSSDGSRRPKTAAVVARDTNQDLNPDTLSGDTGALEAAKITRDTNPDLIVSESGSSRSAVLDVIAALDEEEASGGGEPEDDSSWTIVERRPSWVTLLGEQPELRRKIDEAARSEAVEDAPEDTATLLVRSLPDLGIKKSPSASLDGAMTEGKPTQPFGPGHLDEIRSRMSSREKPRRAPTLISMSDGGAGEKKHLLLVAAVGAGALLVVVLLWFALS